MAENITTLQNFINIFDKHLYTSKKFKYAFDFESDIKTLKKLLLKEYASTQYFSIFLILLDTFYSANKNLEIKTRKQFSKKFVLMIETYINKYELELPVKCQLNQVGGIIQKYLNTKCEICGKNGDYKFYHDETLNIKIPLCFDCATYNKCKLCKKKCLLFLDCQKCKKLYCIPCSLYKTRSVNCLKCNTCSICIDVFETCYCV